MNKWQKQYGFEMIESLEQLHKQLMQCMLQHNYDDVQVLLQDCQQQAITLGTYVEAVEEMSTVLVQRLEEYCEYIYQISCSIAEDSMDSVRTIAAGLDHYVDEFRAKLLEIKEVKEIVFLPYKLSMWDSLEDVWLEMKEQPDVKALVIPIPYYDKNSDGTFGEMHYEGNDFPDDIPIVSYENYDFEIRHPDAIYIHNPYDGSNYVTSVNPIHYSKELKKYTDELVYIPYFVLNEVNPADEGSIAGISNLITVPAVVHAHKVLVQSENFRQIYINEMTKVGGEQTRPYWESKIFVEISPKFRKIQRVKISDFDIPDEWKQMIDGENGQKKKVILYNTGVTSMLRNKEQLLAKMEDVFEFFQHNGDRCVLLWRPHPLMKQTIRSMRGWLLDKYEELENRYINQKIGIYDDSPDLHRAIALCDAYYGDGSSLVSLCRAAGKPVMLQNVYTIYYKTIDR